MNDGIVGYFFSVNDEKLPRVYMSFILFVIVDCEKRKYGNICSISYRIARIRKTDLNWYSKDSTVNLLHSPTITIKILFNSFYLCTIVGIHFDAGSFFFPYFLYIKNELRTTYYTFRISILMRHARYHFYTVSLTLLLLLSPFFKLVYKGKRRPVA